MLTFQILDAGETFFVPLDGGPFVIGSGPDADIRLTEAGVAPMQARLERIGDGDDWKIVDLAQGASGTSCTRVNGKEIAQVRLALGDRVEIGLAVLVLGNRVQRPNSASDVLEPQMVTRTRPPRLRTDRAAAGPSWHLLATIGGAIALVGILGFMWLANATPSSFAAVERARKTGQFDEARALLAGLRKEWAGEKQGRLGLIRDAETMLEGTEAALRVGAEQVRADAPNKDEEQQRREWHAFANQPGPQGEAARLLIGQLTTLRNEGLLRAKELVAQEAAREREAAAQRERAQTARAKPAPVPAPVPAPDTAKVQEPAPAGERAGQAVPRPAETARQPEPPAVARQDAPAVVPVPSPGLGAEGLAVEIDRLQRAGEFAQALALATQALATLPAADAATVQPRIEALRAATRAAGERLIADARQQAGRGAFPQALQLLADAAPRFPGNADLGKVHGELARMQAEYDAIRTATETGARNAGAAHEQARETRKHSLGMLASLMDQIRGAERRSDFGGAASLLEQGAEAVRERDPLFSLQLRGRAEDFRLLGELGTQRVVLNDRKIELALPGGPARVVEISLSGVRVETAEGDKILGWLDLPPEPIRELLVKLGAPPRAFLGGAVLAYRNGANELAEACLVQALKGDPSLESQVFGVIRRGRAEKPDPDGYVLVKDRFVGKREIAAEKLSRQLEAKVARALGLPLAQRDKQVEELLAGGPEVLDALVLAWKRTQVELADRIAKSPFKKTWDRLAAQRTELDGARTFAKELIYDEVKYFYPYNPPACDPVKAATYWPVQTEVSKRVAKVEELWRAGTKGTRVPKALLDDTEQFGWVTKTLRDFGEAQPELEGRVAWVRSLPAEGELTLHNFAKDGRERSDFELWARIEKFNEKRAKDVTGDEWREFQLTNAYRRMFNHRPLALNLKIVAAARGHCEEMSRLGYFAHFSPIPERRTPFDRMKLAGYAQGIGENIALTDGAEGAHNAWLQSSGHHRNLLMASHTEFAVGNNGRYWTQNFGNGKDYLADPLFQ